MHVWISEVEYHWFRYACVGLFPVSWQAITKATADMLSIGHSGTIFSEIFVKNTKYSFNKVHLKILPTELWQLCAGLNVLMQRDTSLGHKYLQWLPWYTNFFYLIYCVHAQNYGAIYMDEHSIINHIWKAKKHWWKHSNYLIIYVQHVLGNMHMVVLYNSLMLSNACMLKKMRLSLVQIMGCCQIDDEPLSEPMLY